MDADGLVRAIRAAPDETELYERLAAIEHERWSDWQRYIHSLCERRADGALVIPVDRVKHWERQISTPYEELPEHEKGMDREQVDRYWPLLTRGLGIKPQEETDDIH